MLHVTPMLHLKNQCLLGFTNKSVTCYRLHPKKNKKVKINFFFNRCNVGYRLHLKIALNPYKI